MFKTTAYFTYQVIIASSLIAVAAILISKFRVYLRVIIATIAIICWYFDDEYYVVAIITVSVSVAILAKVSDSSFIATSMAVDQFDVASYAAIRLATIVIEHWVWVDPFWFDYWFVWTLLDDFTKFKDVSVLSDRTAQFVNKLFLWRLICTNLRSKE